MPRALLLSEGINPVQAFDTQDFLGSHDAVCSAVAAGKYDVGATFNDPPDGDRISGCRDALGRKATALKAIAFSQEVPNDVLVASQRYPDEKAAALFAAAKAAKRETLEAAFLADGVAPVSDEDFAPIRKALDSLVP